MSVRAHFNAKSYIPPLIYTISATKQSNITKLTILIIFQVAFLPVCTSSVRPAPANALLIGLYKSMISAAFTPPLIRLNGMMTGISLTTSALGKPVYIGVTTRFQSAITTVSDKTAHTSDKTAPFVVLFLWYIAAAIPENESVAMMFINAPQGPDSENVTISTTTSMTAASIATSGPKMKPAVVKITSFGSYFKNGNDVIGKRIIAVKTIAMAATAAINVIFFALDIKKTPSLMIIQLITFKIFFRPDYTVGT